MKYGVDLNKFTKTQLEDLAKLGCEPAFHAFALQNATAASEKKKIKKIQDTHQFKYYENTIEKRKASAKLTLFSKSLDHYPLRTLVNPLNKPKLNTKLSIFNKKTINSIKFPLRMGKPFTIKSGQKRIEFTTNNINQIKISILFLNWNILNPNYRKKTYSSSLCLNDNALELLATKGINGLIKAAKKKDRSKLEKYLIGADLIKNLSYFRNISLDLSHFINSLSEEKLRRMIQSFYTISNYKWLEKFSRSPSFALYTDFIMTEQEYIWRLHKIGYRNISHLGFLKISNQNLLREPELAKLLFDNFSNY